MTDETHNCERPGATVPGNAKPAHNSGRDPSTETWRQALDPAVRDAAREIRLRDQLVAADHERDAARAELARTQRALAASQEDLSKALDDRDLYQTAAETQMALVEQAARTADALRDALHDRNAELERERQESGRLRRELEQARATVAPQTATAVRQHHT
jgi:chromosome segregation ATPase